MRKFLLLSLLAFYFGTTIKSQNVNYISSGVPIKEKKLVTVKIIGGIDDKIYTRTITKKKKNGLRLSMYQKENATLLKTLPIKDFGSANSSTIINESNFFNSIICNNQIYVVWVKSTEMDKSVFLQTFDKDLNEIQKPQLVFQISKKKNSLHDASIFFLASPDETKFIVGAEKCSEKNEKIVLQFKLINKDFEILETTQAELPYSLATKSKEATSEYKMDNNGDLYFDTEASISTVINNEKPTPGHLLGKVDSKTSEVNSKFFSFRSKSLQNFNYQINDSDLFVIGSYNELSDNMKDAKYSTGIYSVKINKNSFEELNDVTFSKLDKSKIVYSDYKMSKSDKKKYSVNEFTLNAINNSGLVITNINKTDDKGMLLTLNSQNMYTVCTNSGCQNYTNHHGVIYIRLDEGGEIIWVSCTQVNMIYKEFVTPSNIIIKADDKFFTIIRSSKNSNSSYLIDKETGIMKKAPLELKYKIQEPEEVNGELFFIGYNSKVSTKGWITFGIGAALVPVFIATVISVIVSEPGILLTTFGTSSAPFSWLFIYLGLHLKRNDIYFGKYVLKN